MAFEFNTNAEVRRSHPGKSAVPVTLIDGIFNDPKAVAELGYGASYTNDGSNLYPGVRARVSDDLGPRFAQVLGCDVERCESFFSVVTTAGQDLFPIQCIPHYDSTEPNLLAAVIYLCDNRFSGTSLYRHRRTGYEQITPENQQNYRLALDHDMRMYGRPARGYMNGSNPLFEVTFSNVLKFNSAMVYPGSALHAGNIPQAFTSPRHKTDWRLTITALMRVPASS